MAYPTNEKFGQNKTTSEQNICPCFKLSAPSCLSKDCEWALALCREYGMKLVVHTIEKCRVNVLYLASYLPLSCIIITHILHYHHPYLVSFNLHHHPYLASSSPISWVLYLASSSPISCIIFAKRLAHSHSGRLTIYLEWETSAFLHNHVKSAWSTSKIYEELVLPSKLN